MYSLIQYFKLMCGKRDALSLFVEYCGDNKIRVHRQFYVHSQFETFMTSDHHDFRSLNFRDATGDIDIAEFSKLLFKLTKKRDKTKDDEAFVDELSKILVNSYLFERFDDNEQIIENILDRLNDVFCKYYFSINDNSFHYDNYVYNRVNLLLDSVPYNSEIHFDDYEEGCKPAIEPILENELHELRIYNVGQANCSALIKYTDTNKKDYKVIIVFDLGFQRRFCCNKALEEMINKIDFDTTILISHYDNDHINNIADHLYLTTYRWIFPNYDGRGKKALKTFQMLLKVAVKKVGSRTIYNFPTPFNFSPNISIHQYSGKRIGDSYQSTLMNSKCLVCKLSIGGKDILIPADALYEEYGDELVLPNGKKYDYIFVPHHGCKYVAKALAGPSLKIWNFIDDNTIGVVMCGKNNYGHANIDHLSWFSFRNIHSFEGAFCYKDAKSVIASIGDIDGEYYPINFS